MKRWALLAVVFTIGCATTQPTPQVPAVQAPPVANLCRTGLVSEDPEPKCLIHTSFTRAVDTDSPSAILCVLEPGQPSLTCMTLDEARKRAGLDPVKMTEL